MSLPLYTNFRLARLPEYILLLDANHGNNYIFNRYYKSRR